MPSELSMVVYPGNNSNAIEYPVPFQALEAGHIKVGVRPVGDPFGQLPTWAYAVVPKPGGWAVTTTEAVPAADTVVIWRELPLVQPVELPLAGRLPSTAIEQALDRHTMQIQQLADDIGRCVRLDRTAGEQPDIALSPDSLLGVDANERWTVFGPDKVRELALLGGVDTGNPVATWATEADRYSTPPAFAGQVGTQRSDKSLWVGMSPTGGDWAPAQFLTQMRIVRTTDQFIAAVEAGAPMHIVGEIVLPTYVDILLPLVIQGEPGSRIVLAGTAPYGFSVQAPLLVRDIEVTSASRTAHRAFHIGGPRFVGTFVMQRVRIHNVGCAFSLDGSPTSPLAPSVVIEDCDFEAIGGSGYSAGSIGAVGAVVLSYNLSRVIIQNCRFRDTYGGAIHISESGVKRIPPDDYNNAAVVPNASAAGQIWIVNNWVRDYARNGIEVFGADWAVIAYNKVFGGSGLVPGAGIAISQGGSHGIVHGNYVRDYWGYGIEVVYHHNIVTGNVIDTCTHDRDNPLLAMSIGGKDVTTNCLIAGNHFINIVHKVHKHTCINISRSTDITVTGNKFTNCSLACDVQNTDCERITFTNNEHKFSLGGSSRPANEQVTFAGTSGVRHVVLNNVTRTGGSATPAKFIRFAPGSGGYFNYTSGQQIAGVDYLEVGLTSHNLVIP